MSTSEIDRLCINTIRTLAIDSIQKANSGHPGTPDGYGAGSLRACGRSSSTSIPPIRSGQIAIASSCRPAMPRCCSTRCCI